MDIRDEGSVGRIMELIELKREMKSGKLKPLYIFTGEEVAIMDIFIAQIGAIYAGKTVRVDNLSNVYSKLKNTSFMTGKTCYVIRDDKEYLSQESVWESVRTGASLGPNNMVILVYSSLDKRGKFFKQHEDLLVTFDFLSPEILASYITKELSLSQQSAIELAERCDLNYSKIKLEMNKISNLASGANISHEQALRLAFKENIIYTSPKDDIFKLIDAVCMRKPVTSFSLWKDLNEMKDNTMGVLSLLYTNFRAMLLVQSAGKCDSITERTGLTPWQVKLAKEKGNNYSIPELVRAIRTIREAEKGIKTGWIDQAIAVEYVLVQVL